MHNCMSGCTSLMPVGATDEHTGEEKEQGAAGVGIAAERRVGRITAQEWDCSGRAARVVVDSHPISLE